MLFAGLFSPNIEFSSCDEFMSEGCLVLSYMIVEILEYDEAACVTQMSNNAQNNGDINTKQGTQPLIFDSNINIYYL